MTDKRVLRARLRAARDAFVTEHARAIASPAPYLALLHPGLVVASYIPIGSEADPMALAAAAIDSGCTLALPHVVSRAQPLRFLEWHPDHPLDDGPFGLRQPRHDRCDIMPDIILTPLVGFDADLNRLGQDEEAFIHLDEMTALAKLPNVAVKMTGAPHYSTQPYPFRNIHDGLHRIFDAYGPDRLFWGTDITRMPCTYRQCVTFFTEALPWLRGQDLEKVMGRSLCKWIGWDFKF